VTGDLSGPRSLLTVWLCADGGRTQQGFCGATAVKRWDLRSLAPSSEKRRAREPGADAPRVLRAGRQMPRVLFSSPECRAVVIDLQRGEELGDHQVRERAVVEVIAGRVSIECSGEIVECETGTLVTFEPGEHHTVRALADARLLLLLAPWPAAKLTTESGKGHGQHLPANAVAEPIPSSGTTGDRPA
jgi:quercetin dioxygenase-like cupin family protein